MAATPPGRTSQTEMASWQEPERRKGDRLSPGKAALAIAALSLGLWWLLSAALAALIRALL